MLRESPVYLSSIRGQALVCVCGQRFERLGRNGCCWPVISQRLINLGNLGWCPLTAVAPKRLGNSLNAKPVTVELHIRHCRWRKSLIFRDGSGLHLQQHRRFLSLQLLLELPIDSNALSLTILHRTQSSNNMTHIINQIHSLSPEMLEITDLNSNSVQWC